MKIEINIIIFLICGSFLLGLAILAVIELSIRTGILTPFEKLTCYFENKKAMLKMRYSLLIAIGLCLSVSCLSYGYYFYKTSLWGYFVEKTINFTLGTSSFLVVLYVLSVLDIKRNKKVDELEKEVDNIGKNSN